jgi:thiamine-monophosphate kinase
MGAQPAWCTLSLSLPGSDASWVDGFLDGFLALADQHGVALVGGDTTRGPLSICVTVHGFVDEDAALRRDGARPGDDIWVSGSLGDGAGALALWRDGRPVDPWLRMRLDRPSPRVALGLALAGVAHAAIDVSDGLLADLAHVCDASGVGAELDVDALPASSALHASFDEAARRELQAGGGDDYELCFTATADRRDAIARIARETAIDVTRVGGIVAGSGVRARLADGSEWRSMQAGFVHFQ